MKPVAVGYMSKTVPNFWNKHFFNVEVGLPVTIVVEEENQAPLEPVRDGLAWHLIPKLPVEILDRTGVPEESRSNVYAWWAFIASLVTAKTAGYTHMVYFEEDCRFTKHWGKKIWHEFAFHHQFNKEIKWGGSPVVWHPWSLGYLTSASVFRYGASVLTLTGLPMACEGGLEGPFSLYPNGALAVYDVDWTADLFSDFIEIFNEACDPGIFGNSIAITKFVYMAVRFVAFDFCLGVRSYSLYGGNVFSIGKPLASVYSGCRDHHVPLARRIEMWRSGDKAAVHHIKERELPF